MLPLFSYQKRPSNYYRLGHIHVCAKKHFELMEGFLDTPIYCEGKNTGQFGSIKTFKIRPPTENFQFELVESSRPHYSGDLHDRRGI